MNRKSPAHRMERVLVDFNVSPALAGNGIGYAWNEKQRPVPAECRESSLKLGGNTDVMFALGRKWLRAFLLSECL